MASTYENDLRLEEMATGENSGSWGTKTNTNLELIADAFSYGTETIADADTTITIADGAADAARSLALKINSSEDLTTTRVVTLAPNTTSKVWIIENNTSGGQTLTISAGSGSNITLANGTTKIIATDGIGAGSNVVELTQDLAIADMSVDGILSLADGTNSAPSLTNTGDTNTGLYFPAADEVGITVGGTQVFKADSTGVDVTGAVTATTSTDQAFPLTVSNTDSDSNTYIKYLDNGGQFWSTGINYANNDFYFNYNGSFIGRFLNAGGLELTRADNDAVLIIKSTDADANDGPIFDLIRDSSSPADNDGIGSIRWKADDSAGNETQYADIRVFTDDVTDGTEDVNFTLRGIRNGTLVSRLAFNASEMVINDSSNDVDFRVESDNNANMLFVDAGNDQVVVGDNGNYFSKFTVVGGKTRSTGIPLNQLSVYDNSAMASSTGGAITLWGKYTTGGAQAEGASIEAYKSNGTSGNYQYGMWLKTRTHGGSMDDRLFMDQVQTVFNETGASTDFRVESDSNANMFFVDAGQDNVGIGQSSNMHGNRLNIEKSNSQGDGPEIVLKNLYRSGNLSAGEMGAIVFGAWRDISPTGAYVSAIAGYDNDTAGLGNSGQLRFFTRGNGTSNPADIRSTSYLRMTINSTGYKNHSYDTGATTKEIFNWSNNTTGMSFRSAGVQRGSIYFLDSGVSFNTTSDYRLKENVIALSGATERLKQLEPKRFNFIADADTTVDGFIAHEVQSIVPEAITGEKDGMTVDEEGNTVPNYQGIDQSKLVPLLVATIKELEARITELENA